MGLYNLFAIFIPVFFAAKIFQEYICVCLWPLEYSYLNTATKKNSYQKTSMCQLKFIVIRQVLFLDLIFFFYLSPFFFFSKNCISLNERYLQFNKVF